MKEGSLMRTFYIKPKARTIVERVKIPKRLPSRNRHDANTSSTSRLILLRWWRRCTFRTSISPVLLIVAPDSVQLSAIFDVSEECLRHAFRQNKLKKSGYESMLGT